MANRIKSSLETRLKPLNGQIVKKTGKLSLLAASVLLSKARWALVLEPWKFHLIWINRYQVGFS